MRVNYLGLICITLAILIVISIGIISTGHCLTGGIEEIWFDFLFTVNVLFGFRANCKGPSSHSYSDSSESILEKLLFFFFDCCFLFLWLSKVSLPLRGGADRRGAVSLLTVSE